MFSGYWGFVGGGMLFFAQYYGAKDDDGIDRSYGITLAFMMTVAAVFASLALLAPEFVMKVYTDKTSIQAIGVKYLRIVGMAYPLQILSMAMSALLRSTDRVRIPFYASVASVGTNMLLNWVFIYGNLGLPSMGVQGAALATVCAALVNVLVIVVLAKLQKYPYLFHFTKHFRWKKEHIKAYLVKCFPIICNEVLIGVANMLINMVLGRQPEEAIAATAVFRTLEGLFIGFFAGVSNASSVLVGTCVGAGELDTAYELAKRMVLLCGSVIACCCLTLLALHKPVLTAMSLSGESFRIGFGMLCVYCVVAIIRMCNWTQNDTYRSAGDATTGTVLEISFMYLMVLPTLFIMAYAVKAPFLVIFACCYIDEPIRFVLMQRHMYSDKWVRPVTEQGIAALPAFREKHSKKRAHNEVTPKS